MASRMCIAAAGCVVASGLFMTGASAAVAVAEPASDQGGEGGEAQADGAVDAGPVTPSEVEPSGPSSRAPGVEAAAPVAAAVPTKPTSQLGDGRNGRPVGDAGGYRGPPPAGKPTPALRPPPRQTPPPRPGEPAGTVEPTGPAGPPTEPWHEHPPGPSWPWWGGPCPEPDDPDDPDGPGLPPGTGVGSGGSAGGGGVPQAKPPRGRPELPPAMQLPPPRETSPELPSLSADPLADAGAGLPVEPIAMPAIVVPVGAGGPGGPGGSRPGTPTPPRASGDPQRNQPPPRSAQQEVTAFGVGNGIPPASFRVGYGNYLRTAGVGQMMAVAVPGVAGILMLTGAGGLLGYRQARAGHAVRANGTARFMD